MKTPIIKTLYIDYTTKEPKSTLVTYSKCPQCGRIGRMTLLTKKNKVRFIHKEENTFIIGHDFKAGGIKVTDKCEVSI